MSVDQSAVEHYLADLQDRICTALSALDGADFVQDRWSYEGGGGGRSRVLSGGSVIEKGGVNFSHVHGSELPPAATQKRPELAGKAFEAMGVSLVIHPDNPFAPTSHMNVRFFIADASSDNPIWWFGGGFDLTPSYGFEEDAKHWHAIALQACGDQAIYERYKTWCDDYFYLPHRDETRGVGGLFYDDLSEPNFEKAFSLTKSVGDNFLPAYEPIVEKRRDTPYGEQERDFQLYRRGRYVEFNLVYDRGTLFGLQSGGRTESILMSLPPEVRWRYDWQPEAGSKEAELYERYLKPQEWLK